MPDKNLLLTQVVQRYDLVLPAGDNFFYPQLHLNGLDKEFIFAILNSFDDKVFNAAEFEPFSIEMIVDYIQRTHIFYLQNKLPEIEQSILQLSSYYNPNHPLLAELQVFFNRYRRELTEHFSDEETKLMPYIVLLRNAESSPKYFSKYIFPEDQYSIAQFLTGHHDTEDELAAIRKVIRMYNPPATNQSLYRILLYQLETFEKDLHVHALMEEKVLIPKALAIETALNSKVFHAINCN